MRACVHACVRAWASGGRTSGLTNLQLIWIADLVREAHRAQSTKAIRRAVRNRERDICFLEAALFEAVLEPALDVEAHVRLVGEVLKEEHAVDEFQSEHHIQLAALGDRERGFLVLVVLLARCEAGL